MGFLNYKKSIVGTYLDRRNPPYMFNNRALGSVRTMANSSPASFGNGGGNSYDIERFNYPKDRLEEGSVLEDWIPRQPTALHLMFRKIYLRDAIAGTVVDLFSTLPWGKTYDLTNVQDPKVIQMFKDMIEGIDCWGRMPMICREHLVIGRYIGSLNFNERLGYWDSLTPIDPDQAKITPMPISGHKPLIDVLSSPGWRNFARSTDPRILELKEKLSPELLEVIENQSGYIPLDAFNTLWVARRVNEYDHLGTSMYSRILPAWAYETALWNASLTGVRRRNRAILLVQAGIEDKWVPNDEDIASLSSLFMQADEDPTGAIVAVRNGVEVSEVRDATAIWGISQEFEFLSTLKMRALGVSEAYLNGETNVSNMETASTSLAKSVNAYKDFMLREIYTKQLFPTFARIHNIQKRTQAELDHRIRISGKTKITAREAMDIPLDALVIPDLATEDTLRPQQDPAYLEVLSQLKGEGVPIPIRLLASAAGLDLNKIMAMMEEDFLLRKRITQLGLGEAGGGGGGETGGGGAEEKMMAGEEPEAGGEEAPGPGGSAEDLFGGGGEEKASIKPGTSDNLPPKWNSIQGKALPFQTLKTLAPRKFDEAKVQEALDFFKNAPVTQALAHIDKRILVDLSIPNSKALVPYSD